MAESVLQRDRPCGRCGYNLRGLALSGNCPECGTGVWRSVRGDALEWTDPQWVGSLRLGSRLILIPQAVLIVAVALELNIRGLVPWFRLLAVAAVAACAAGAWLVGSPAAALERDRGYRLRRRALRWTCALPPIAPLLSDPFIALTAFTLLCAPPVLFTFWCLHDAAAHDGRRGLATTSGLVSWAAPLGLLAGPGLAWPADRVAGPMGLALCVLPCDALGLMVCYGLGVGVLLHCALLKIPTFPPDVPEVAENQAAAPP